MDDIPFWLKLVCGLVFGIPAGAILVYVVARVATMGYLTTMRQHKRGE